MLVRRDRHRFARQRRLVDAQLAGVHELGVRGDTVAGCEQEQVPGHDVLGRDLDRIAVPADADAEREDPAEGRHRLLGAVLLGEREAGVDRDHHHDRHGERRGPAELGQHRGQPQQQRQRVDHLVEQLAPPRTPAAADQLVRPVGDQPAPGLPVAQPLAAAAQVTQQPLERFLGVHVAIAPRRAGSWSVPNDPDPS